ALPALGERGGGVRVQGRLADAALARSDGDHARTRIEPDLTLWPPATEPRRERGLLVRRHHVEPKRDARDARHGPDVLRDLILEARPERTARDGQRDDDHDRPVRRDGDVAHHVELGDGALELGVDDTLERREDRVAVWSHEVSLASTRRPWVTAACNRPLQFSAAPSRPARRGRSSPLRRPASAARGRAVPPRTADPRTARSRSPALRREAGRRRCRSTGRAWRKQE